MTLLCRACVKEVDLYSAFIVVPHTQGAQVRITEFYLQVSVKIPLKLCLYFVPFLRSSASNNSVTLKSGARVVQGR